MYQLRTTVIHALGTFVGVLQTDFEGATYENVCEFVDAIQKSINRMERLTLTQNDGAEITFPEQVLRQSIIIIKIEEI